MQAAPHRRMIVLSVSASCESAFAVQNVRTNAYAAGFVCMLVWVYSVLTSIYTSSTTPRNCTRNSLMYKQRTYAHFAIATSPRRTLLLPLGLWISGRSVHARSLSFSLWTRPFIPSHHRQNSMSCYTGPPFSLEDEELRACRDVARRRTPEPTP